jgi:hypothetical protein
MDGNACADECCRDLRLEIREGEDEVGLERGIFGIWAEVKAEKVKRFDRLLRQADDPRGRKLVQECRRSLRACQM